MTPMILSSVTNNHVSGFLARLGETLRLWRLRARTRRELARLNERELHDVGLAWSSIAEEVDKPFWRA